MNCGGFLVLGQTTESPGPMTTEISGDRSVRYVVEASILAPAFSTGSSRRAHRRSRPRYANSTIAEGSLLSGDCRGAGVLAQTPWARPEPVVAQAAGAFG